MMNPCVYNVVVNDTPVTHLPWGRIVRLTTDACINIIPQSVYAQEVHQHACTLHIDREITLQHAIYCCESVISLLPFLPARSPCYSAEAHKLRYCVKSTVYLSRNYICEYSGVALALKIGGHNCRFFQFEYSTTMIIYGKK